MRRKVSGAKGEADYRFTLSMKHSSQGFCRCAATTPVSLRGVLVPPVNITFGLSAAVPPLSQPTVAAALSGVREDVLLL